ncbi:Ig domain-containing protein [Burkholderia sp. RS02]|uniref:Ig domain-containing protein n=1 Tax=unclassified Burkholderia TaxID=2613784 RepID=UPI0032187F52
MATLNEKNHRVYLIRAAYGGREANDPAATPDGKLPDAVTGFEYLSDGTSPWMFSTQGNTLPFPDPDMPGKSKLKTYTVSVIAPLPSLRGFRYSLPKGLKIDEDGIISGIPSDSPGVYSFGILMSPKAGTKGKEVIGYFSITFLDGKSKINDKSSVPDEIFLPIIKKSLEEPEILKRFRGNGYECEINEKILGNGFYRAEYLGGRCPTGDVSLWKEHDTLVIHGFAEGEHTARPSDIYSVDTNYLATREESAILVRAFSRASNVCELFVLRITVVPLLVKGLTKLPPRNQGERFVAQLAAEGWVPPYKFFSPNPAISQHKKLRIISLKENGEIEVDINPVSGDFPGQYDMFRVWVVDAEGDMSCLEYEIEILDQLSFFPENLNPGVQGMKFIPNMFIVYWKGGHLPIIDAMKLSPIMQDPSKDFPAGMNFRFSPFGWVAEVTGTPTVAGEFNYHLRAEAVRNEMPVFEATHKQSLTILSQSDGFSSVTIPPGEVGRETNWTNILTHKDGYREVRLIAGEIPRGLNLHDNYLIEGEPLADGDYKFATTAVTVAGNQKVRFINSIRIEKSKKTDVSLNRFRYYTYPGGRGVVDNLDSYVQGKGITGLTISDKEIIRKDGFLSYAGILADVDGRHVLSFQVGERSYGTYPVVLEVGFEPHGVVSDIILITVLEPGERFPAHSGAKIPDYLRGFDKNITFLPLKIEGAKVGTPISGKILLKDEGGQYEFFLKEGVLPGGGVIDSNGEVSCTPDRPGIFSFGVEARSKNNKGSGFHFYLISVAPGIRIFPEELSQGAWVGGDYKQQLSVENAEGNVKFNLLDNRLPKGISLTESGVLSGVPVEGGIFKFRVEASDAHNYIGKIAYKMVVEEQPVMAPHYHSLPHNQLKITIDLSEKAHGGKFFDAEILSIEHGDHGKKEARIELVNDRWMLYFEFKPNFHGPVAIEYRLKNHLTWSKPGIVRLVRFDEPKKQQRDAGSS